MDTSSMDDGYRKRARALQELVVMQHQSLVTRLRQVQEWSLSNGRLTGGQDADAYRLRREQVQQAQQQIERLQQRSQGSRHGY